MGGDGGGGAVIGTATESFDKFCTNMLLPSALSMAVATTGFNLCLVCDRIFIMM